MIELFFVLTMFLAIYTLLNKSGKIHASVLLIHALGMTVVTISGFLELFSSHSSLLQQITTNPLMQRSYFFKEYFFFDPPNVFIILTTNILYLGIALYHRYFFQHSDADIKRKNLYTLSFLSFIFSMAAMLMSAHLALLWVFLELSTLSSAFLIIYDKSKYSLEAAWKYLFICSIGIALAFMGIILLSVGLGPTNTLFFKQLYSNLAHNPGSIHPFWLKISYIFILIGLGTKTGLAPVHTWLPDAHSESPSPVSAMFSGALLNIALLGIIRVNKIMYLAGFAHLVNNLLYIMGMMSIIVCAIYMFKVKNYKRMLAYSSVENMGLICIGLATGGLGTIAAYLHIISHSLTKSAFFLTAGNIIKVYGTKSMSEVKGLFKASPWNGFLWLACFLSLIGLPPFPIFLSEFLIVKALLAQGHYILTIALLLLLLAIFAGMGKHVFRMLWGEDPLQRKPFKSELFSVLTPALFLTLLFLSGLFYPDFLSNLIELCANFT